MATADDYARHLTYGILPPGLAITLVGATDAPALARAVETGDQAVNIPSGAVTALNTAVSGSKTAAIHRDSFRRRGSS